MANGDWDATHTEMDAGVSDPTSTAGGQETPDVVAEEPGKFGVHPVGKVHPRCHLQHLEFLERISVVANLDMYRRLTSVRQG